MSNANFTPNKSVKVIDGRTYTHRTRDGLPARILCTDIKNDGSEVAFAYLAGKGEILTYCDSKLRYLGEDRESKLDLVEGAEPGPDWSKAAVDTPIWVRDHPCNKWHKRHFARFWDGDVWAWDVGCTSHTSSSSTDQSRWNHATLTNPYKE